MPAIASTSNSGVDVRDLEELLEAFGSCFCLENIASAYVQAKHNKNVAAEILCSMDDTTLATSISQSEDKLEGGDEKSLKLQSESENPSVKALELTSDNGLHKSFREERNTRPFKSKNCPVSMGNVSSVIGKEYFGCRPLMNDYHEPTKPLKLTSKELLVSEIWSEDVPPSTTSTNRTICPDIEEFLFKMLGDGFQLDMSVIQEVLGQCGFDAQKSMEKLIDLSASTLKVSDDFVDMTAEKPAENFPDQKLFLQQEQMIHLDSAQRDGASFMPRNLTELPKSDRDRIGLQKEILESLFIVPERSEEAPKRKIIVRPARRSRAFGKVVFQPYKDTTQKKMTVSAEAQEDTRDDEDGENSFEVLREAVKEHWITMKEYYKAAFDAFAKGDHARANRLLQQGHCFNQRAREADEKSAQKLVEFRDDEVVSFDWRELEPKEAIRLLRTHLTSLGGIPSIKYLRVIVGTDDEDTTKGARKRIILKQLEKESIKYDEESNGQAILIRMDIIDPKRLSFAKKN